MMSMAMEPNSVSQKIIQDHKTPRYSFFTKLKTILFFTLLKSGVTIYFITFSLVSNYINKLQ